MRAKLSAGDGRGTEIKDKGQCLVIQGLLAVEILLTWFSESEELRKVRRRKGRKVTTKCVDNLLWAIEGESC